MKPRCIIVMTVISLLVLVAGTGATWAQTTPVLDAHLQSINNNFKQNRILNGYAELDTYGRVQLKGGYDDDRQVDLAFSLAQTVVGVKWVSPVTPDNIKVKEWEKRIGSLFSRARVLNETGPDGAPGFVRNRYALVVGVGQFKYGIQSLQYTVRDASSFYSFLVNPQGAAFPRNNVYYLTDQTATRDNIMKYLNTIKKAAGPDDLVVIYMSSHGTPPDKFGGVHIVTYDTEVKPRERVWHTAVTETMLKDFVETLRSKRLVMILDTCYSNGAYRSIPGFLPPGGKSLGADEDEWYGISKDYGKRLFGAKDITLDDTPKKTNDRGKSVDNQDGYGKVLLSASSAGEKSWESDSLKNSVFTYYFVDGLKKYNGSVKDAFTYSKPLVSQRVKQEKGSDISQTPQAMATSDNWNMRITK
ncbi:MAG: caspase family protein [Syntrophorhabdaceae bacterium]